MLSQQEMSDRFEIQDLCYRYAELVDTRNFDALATDVFTADAHIDYSELGGSVGNLQDTISFLKKALTPETFPSHQHLNGNIQISLQGDKASGRVMLFNPQEMSLPEGGTQIFVCGLWYLDKYVRTPAGWRMQERVEEKSYVFNAPDFLNL
ncbi:nuclear transport factor 2 family protein [Halieaceae bacterium IMCC14734]|uniref:Nuclear transport factor 2 family protein n=1 Tax=Candidatus Litorirhabdus singularis TaxID=2518993 RepID=A0ABT3TG78_9GAMM|nr:nuclear transport factor 2 family protein [Candidatus Litorirhabdus singularis]MCX2981210.1 nuclear transport factor 2 family protein [Candidatus Litorirhabdus singularis]